MNKNKIDFCYIKNFIGKNIIVQKDVSSAFEEVRMLSECPISCSSVLIKKNILNKNIYTNLKTKEDYVLWLRIAKNKYKFGGINKLLTGYRIRDNSLSTQHLNKLINAFKIYNKFNNFSVIMSALYVIRLYSNAFIKKYL